MPQDLSDTSSSLSSIPPRILAPVNKRSSTSRPNGLFSSSEQQKLIQEQQQLPLAPHNRRRDSSTSGTPGRASATLESIHKSLRKALNVHPEKYRTRNLSRSASPQLMVEPTQQIRSKSIDLSNVHNRRRSRETGSLTHEAMTMSQVPTIQLSQAGLPAEDLGQFEESCANGIEIMFTDDEDAGPNDVITINVSGMRFQTREKTLLRFPETLLGNPFKRRKYYDAKMQEYFFDRHRACFESILHIYQSNGEVFRPETIPIDLYLNELKFFQFSGEIFEKFWINEGYQKPPDPKMPTNKVQRAIWELMEYPDSSLAARIFAFASIAVIVTSIISFCLETIPELKPVEDMSREWNSAFFWVEFCCSIWFSAELILRFVSAPDKYDFIKSFLNVLDFVAVAPFFVNVIWFADKSASSMSFSVLRIIRLVRVFRIFKLSRHSVGLQVLGKTFRASIQEFCLLIFFLVIALVLFSSGVYFAEQGEPDTKFTSIPASFWFVLATLSTVGYGDLVPTGVYGKIVGSCCALIGVITLALPVPIIVANFKHFYRQECRLAQMYNIAQQENASIASRKSFDVG